MEKKAKICDRCRNEIKYGKFPVTKVSRIKTILLFGFGAYDYSDSSIELCTECTRSFDAFMSNQTPTKPA